MRKLIRFELLSVVVCDHFLSLGLGLYETDLGARRWLSLSFSRCSRRPETQAKLFRRIIPAYQSPLPAAVSCRVLQPEQDQLHRRDQDGEMAHHKLSSSSMYSAQLG